MAAIAERLHEKDERPIGVAALLAAHTPSPGTKQRMKMPV
jgi:hypothetical protein